MAPKLFTYKLFTYDAEKARQTLAIDAGYYEDQEEWDNHQLVMDLFIYITKNAVNGMITLNQEQRNILIGSF